MRMSFFATALLRRVFFPLRVFSGVPLPRKFPALVPWRNAPPLLYRCRFWGSRLAFSSCFVTFFWVFNPHEGGVTFKPSFFSNRTIFFDRVMFLLSFLCLFLRYCLPLDRVLWSPSSASRLD